MHSRDVRILALLFASAFLVYIDRANLSVGATNIMRDLHLSPYFIGILLSAFFWTYASCQLLGIAGWAADRFNVCWVLAGGFTLWSVATAFAGMARSFAFLFAMRLMLGLGESVAYPCYSRILANYFPEHRRGFANATIEAGTKAGPALGALVGGLLMARFGWRPFFIVLGFGTLAWLVPWFMWMPRGQGLSVRQDPSEVPGIREILRHRSAIFSAIGLFCSNYFWFFLLTWIPAYLETERRFAKDKMAVFASLAFFAVAVSATFHGWLSDHLIARGGSPTRVRKSFAGLGLLFSTIILPVAVVRNESIAMVLLLLTCWGYGIFGSNLWAITQTLAGPRAAGKWTSMQNGFGTLSGVVAPWFTGWVVQRTGEFYLAFVVAAAIALAGAAAYVVGIGPIEQVTFRMKQAQPASAD